MKFHRPATRFFTLLTLIVFGALALRVVYIVAVTQDDQNLYDATYYELQARDITHGGGFFNDPFLPFRKRPPLPAADHPPLTVLTLLPAAFVEDPHDSAVTMRLTMALVGTAAIVLIALLTRELAGDVAGLVAAGIAALDPNLWTNDGLIMSEALAVLLAAALMLCVYRIVRRGPSWPRVLGLGALAGLAILARAEFVLFVPFLVVPALWVAARDRRRTALGVIAGAGAATLLVLAPWVGYNLSRFEKPTLISTNDGLSLRAANCPATFHGPRIGTVVVIPPCTELQGNREQSVWNATIRSEGIDYVLGHLDRVPVVALVRLGRVFNVYDLRQSAYLASGEGRPTWAGYLGAVATWILLPIALYGGVRLRRRRTPIWPLVVPIVTTTTAIALWSGGLLRYRAPAEASFVVLAAIGIAAFAASRGREDWFVTPWTTAMPPATPEPAPAPAVTSPATSAAATD